MEILSQYGMAWCLFLYKAVARTVSKYLYFLYSWQTQVCSICQEYVIILKLSTFLAVFTLRKWKQTLFLKVECTLHNVIFVWLLEKKKMSACHSFVVLQRKNVSLFLVLMRYSSFRDKSLRYLRKGCKKMSSLTILYCRNVTKSAVQKMQTKCERVLYNADDPSPVLPWLAGTSCRHMLLPVSQNTNRYKRRNDSRFKVFTKYRNFIEIQCTFSCQEKFLTILHCVTSLF